jgi:hypothetical protein
MEPNKLLLCQPSTKLDEQWSVLYEGAFPVGEREPTDKLARLIEEGKLLYHRTTNEEGVLLCFTMVTLAPSFSFLAYMATNPQIRSGGVGTKHLQRLIEVLKERYPHHLGLFLEIEATAPKSEILTSEEQTNRLRRRKFYEQRIGARVLCQDVPYLTPRFGNENGKEWEGELLAIEFSEILCQEDVVRVICEIYERFYLLPPGHALVTRVIQAFKDAKHTCETPPGHKPHPAPVSPPQPAPIVEPAPVAVPQPDPLPQPQPQPAPESVRPTFFLWRWAQAVYAFLCGLLRKSFTG